MKFNKMIKVYGDPTFRGPCPKESLEQITFFNRIRVRFPATYGVIAVHVRNEGKLKSEQVARQKAEGMTPGASDIIIPGSPSFVCELKRQDHTKSTLSDEQIKYLLAAQNLGSFTCIALGIDGVWEAFNKWREL